MSILLSVVVPIYNGSAYVKGLIEQIRENLCEEVEFVLVNDGSTDNTAELLGVLCRDTEHIKIVSKENGGVSSARNCGIKNSLGKYIWFVDADDMFGCDAVREACGFVKQNSELYVFDAVCEKNGKATVIEGFEHAEPFKNDTDAAKIMMRNIMTSTKTNAVWNKVFKREIIEKYDVKFPVGVINGEDTMFLLDYCDKIENVCYIKKSLYRYIIHNGSAANNIRPQTVKGFASIYGKKTEYCKKYELNDITEHIQKDFPRKLMRAFFHIKRNKKVNNKALKECIREITEDEFVRGEIEKSVDTLKGTVKLYGKMHIKKNVFGIYSLVSAMAVAYNTKRRFVK